MNGWTDYATDALYIAYTIGGDLNRPLFASLECPVTDTVSTRAQVLECYSLRRILFSVKYFNEPPSNKS